MLPDLPLFMDVNSFARATPWLHGLIVAYTSYGEVLFAVLLAAGLWVARGSGDARMRIYVAAHYPHDVLAGLLIGSTVSLVGWLLVRGVLTRVVTALHATRLRPLLSSAPLAPHRSGLVESDPVRPG
jgi:hypothetical protein